MSKKSDTQERIERTRIMLSEGWSKGAVKEALRKRYGDLSARTLENYISGAKKLILEAAGVSEAELRADSLAFYQSLRIHPDATPIARLKAQERIDKLMGLEKPIKVAATNVSGEDLPTRMTPAELRAAMQAELAKVDDDDQPPPTIKRVCLLTAEERRKWDRRISTATNDELPRLAQLHNSYFRPELLTWGQHFLPHYLTKPPSRMHHWLIQRLQYQYIQRGSNIAVVAPRSGAKTTWCTKINTIYDVCEQLEPYILLVSDTEKQAKRNLKAIKSELTGNPMLRECYPHVCGRGDVWNTTEIETRNGIKIEALGAGTSSRGATFLNFRASLIVIDDLMNDDAARSQTQRESLWEWFTRALLPMGDTQTNVFFVGTALHRDDALQRLKKTAGWEFETFQSLISEPTRQDLWLEWKRLFCDPFNKHRGQAARTFYLANEVEMNRGADVLWPENESLYDLMVFRNKTSESSFQAEKQGNPSAASKAEWPDEYFPAHIWFDRWPECHLKVMALDPSKGRTDTSDFSAFVIVGLSLEGILYVEADISRRDTSRIIEDGFSLYYQHRPDDVVVEINQFQELLKDEFERQATLNQTLMPLTGVDNVIRKETRIRMLGPYLSQGKVRFKSSSKSTELLVEQLREFPFGSHDDGPDAFQMAIKDIERLLTVTDEGQN